MKGGDSATIFHLGIDDKTIGYSVLVGYAQLTQDIFVTGIAANLTNIIDYSRIRSVVMRLVFGIHNQFLIHFEEINGRLVMTFDLELNTSWICFL